MVVRMRHTRAHTKNRRSHHALKAPTLSACSHCGGKHRPHHMCLNCGYYNGKQVIDLEKSAKDRATRMQAKRERIRNELGQTTPASLETTDKLPEAKGQAEIKKTRAQTKKPQKPSL